MLATTETGAETAYIVDGQSLTGYSQVLAEDAGADGTFERHSVFADRVLFEATQDVLRHVVTDGHSGTRALLGTGQVYAYDADGNLLGVLDPGDALAMHLHHGERYDAISESYDQRSRLRGLDGRWLSQDSYLPGPGELWDANLYSFVGGDAINKNDPTGMFFTFGTRRASTSISLAMRSPKVGAALKAYDAAETIRDAVTIVGQLATTGTVSPALLAGLLSNVIPFGELFSKARVLGNKLDGAGGVLSDAFQGLRNSGAAASRRAVTTIGELGAITTARKLGLKSVDDFPTRYHGIDGVFEDAAGRLVIVEAKGGAGNLARLAAGHQQLSKQWIEQQIKTLRDKKSFQWAKKLEKARTSGKLDVLLVKTPIDKATGVVADPSFTRKTIGQIGQSNF